jgi:adenine phosphoribosyltransferase
MTIAQGTTLSERVRSAMRNVVGFPHPTSKQFCDISPVAEGDPALFRAVIDAMAKFCEEVAPDYILCVESWGYIFGAPVAYVLGRRMCFARRPGKLPRETFVEAYEMSYAPSKALAIQGEAIRQGDRVVIVDDIIASGGSALASINLIEKAGGHCAGMVCLAAFPNWGIKLLTDRAIPVHAIACW